MWSVFAVHLREGWTRPICGGGGGRGGERGSAGERAGGGNSGIGGNGDELLAKEVDAELFVLFLRNLHITSSIASGVGGLCASLAEEVCVQTTCFIGYSYATRSGGKYSRQDGYCFGETKPELARRGGRASTAGLRVVQSSSLEFSLTA